MTTVRDAEIDIWPQPPPRCGNCEHDKRDHILQRGTCRPGFTCPSSCAAYVSNKSLEDKPAQEPVLPRPIKPEDVQVGMVVERRKGESYVGGRVKNIEEQASRIETDAGVIAWRSLYASAHGWSLWLVEDEPAPVDPDAEALDQMAQAMANLVGSDDADEWVPWAEVALDALRETHDVTARAEE